MKRTRARLALLSMIGIVSLVAVGCGGGNTTATSTTNPPAAQSPTPSSAASGASGTVGVTEKDFAIALDTSSVGSGQVTFNVTNQGPSTHEFVVFKTDLAPDKLPVDDSKSEVEEEGQGLEPVDEIEDIESGATQTLSVNLAPGHYVVICNITAHYQSGMQAELTVV
jgi:uncharacterized cupredoxin-like copper-binding protein